MPALDSKLIIIMNDILIMEMHKINSLNLVAICTLTVAEGQGLAAR